MELALVIERMVILDLYYLLALHVKHSGPTIRYIYRTKFGSFTLIGFGE